MSIVVTDVVTQFGSYYKAGGDNALTLRNAIYQPSQTAAYFQLRPTEDTQWRGTYSSLNRVIQPYQKAFTPIGTLTFAPNKFDLFKLKIDLQETPDDLEATYLGFLTSVPDADRANWPFVRWWLMNHVMPKKDEDLELNEYFDGVYAAPTPGTAGSVSTAMDGLKKIIKGYNTDGRTNLGDGPIVTGAAAADAADFCTQVEDFAASMPHVFRKKIDFIFMSADLELRYKQGKRAKYNMMYAQSPDLLTVEDFPNMKVVGLESHGSSELMWATIAANRIRPMKKATLADTMKVQQFAPRVVSAYSDWWEVLNFEVPEFIFHNDQDLA